MIVEMIYMNIDKKVKDFDNKALSSHRVIAAILSAILKLPPAKRTLANQQVKSIYLDRLLSINDK